MYPWPFGQVAAQWNAKQSVHMRTDGKLRTTRARRRRPIVIAAAVLFIPLHGAEATPVRKGKLKLSLSINLHAPRDLAVREPSMCDGKAKAKIAWNSAKGRVRVKAKFKGLPYRPSLCHDGDVSTPYNEFPECVEDGVWQGWLVGRLFTETSDFYYDTDSGELLGNEFDFDGVPADATVVELPVAQMVCTGTFESSPESLQASYQYDFDYDELLDNEGTAGTYFTQLPYNLYDPSSLDVWYLVGGLPIEQAMHWDDVLDDLEAGVGGVMFATSYEPEPKPDSLLATDNPMTGWGAVYPIGAIPELEPDEACGSYQVPAP